MIRWEVLDMKVWLPMYEPLIYLSVFWSVFSSRGAASVVTMVLVAPLTSVQTEGTTNAKLISPELARGASKIRSKKPMEADLWLPGTRCEPVSEYWFAEYTLCDLRSSRSSWNARNVVLLKRYEAIEVFVGMKGASTCSSLSIYPQHPSLAEVLDVAMQFLWLNIAI